VCERCPARPPCLVSFEALTITAIFAAAASRLMLRAFEFLTRGEMHRPVIEGESRDVVRTEPAGVSSVRCGLRYGRLN
jgi:hypothetical protein